MSRVKRGTRASKRRKSLLKHTKGFNWRRKTHYRLAKDALLHAWPNVFNDRKKKKADFRQLWNVKINAASRSHGMSYSRFMAGLKKNNIEIDRKVLAVLAENEPNVFEKIVEK